MIPKDINTPETWAIIRDFPAEVGLADEIVSVDMLADRLCACCRSLADCRA
ncbi:MAG: hypothetical protein GY841_09860 [FCB group bacterium]|nr:hypothetical protein [FCB group bacterium]